MSAAAGRFAPALMAALWLVAQAPGSAGEILTPPYFNLAEGRRITATATCGDEGPELYCKLVGANAHNDNNINVIQGQVCDDCDLNTQGKNHPPEYAVDGMESWWQSPPLSRGMKYNEVNLTIDLGQEFHVAYVFVRMGNSPRPGLWALEKSSDYGKTYTPWQYFSDSPSDCETHFGKDSLLPITEDDSVICNTEYSKIVPLEGGEIPISLLNNRPSANMYFNSSILQEWTRATNVRLRLLRTKTLLGHLMSVARQDPTVTRRYFYSIKDISIGGRCMCNGHADTCDIPDPIDPNKLQCRCQHHTCGPQCERCCPGYEQKAWRQSQLWQKFVCEACNCFNHSNECEYDAKIDTQHLSLDIHGKYEGGGVCKNCQHNTEGINCNKCKPKFYRPYEKKWNEIDVCKPCDCDNHFSTGNCAEGSGQCECRKEFRSPYCDECSYGYFGYPDCIPCICNLNGTDGDFCEPKDGFCPCKPNYSGNFCEICAEGYYNFPKCEECDCNAAGSVSVACDQESGNCTCKSNFAGRTCKQCEAGFYNYPECKYCNCDASGTLPRVCDNFTGICVCKEGFGGPRCDQCIAGYYSEMRDRERVCVECHCSVNGSSSTTCDATGKCSCLNNFVGRRCDKCSPGYYKYPDCFPCNCDSRGAEGVACDETGQCHCKGNFDDFQCSSCREGFYNFPRCEECNCDPNGVIQSFAGCGSVPAGELCQCKERVQGRICDECRPLYWNLQQNNILGCQECECDVRGTQAGIGTCDDKSGQCSCKYAVTERACDECKDGSYDLTESNIFGCTDCGCDVGGAVNNICDKKSGKCKCRPRIEGLRCDKPLKTHYFPTLHQYQYEIEDGVTPSGNAVRYGFSQNQFPDYSWKGYAVFSPLQNEVLQNIEIQKSSVYQMVLRYVNLNPDPIVGKITITPDNPSETEQRFDVLLKPSINPRFITVSGLQGLTPSPFVMNPGKWTVSIMTDKSLFLDYFVLIPAAYYEATILLQKIDTPCIVGEKSLCRHFGYPNINNFDSVQANTGRITKGNDQYNINKFIDRDQIQQLQETEIPLIDNDEEQLELELIISKPGDYVLLLEYVTPANGRQGGGYITANIHRGAAQSSSKIFLNSCTYTSPCRHILLDDNKTVQTFTFNDFVQLKFKGDGNATVGLKSVVAIPVEQWHVDYMKPQPICIRKNGNCIQSEYPFPPDSKKIELETEEVNSSNTKPTHIYDNSTELVYLNGENNEKYLSAKVPYPGQYVFIVQYYQPNYPESKMEVFIQNGQFYEGVLPIKHCPSNSGCRSVVQMADGSNRFSLTENFDISFRATGNEIWLDYLLIVPANQYLNSHLNENKLDQTREFISTCGNNNFHINITEEGFCRDAVFSLTSDYNNGVEACRCDYLGSHSFECDIFGGQCKCKPNIIGRKCEICKTGYYGFPDCKVCDCPSTALCEKETGECICPSKVTGERCDKCMPLTYGFDPVIGCEDCNCDPSGVEIDKMQCDLFNGSCTCKRNVIGRTCDRCLPGHFQFPDCELCECDLKGTTDEICDQETAICFCKSNVYGSSCDSCKDGTFDLQEHNDAGCTKCFCFGKTIRCNSANLYWDKTANMEGWALFKISISNNLNITQYSSPPKQNNFSSISADLSEDMDLKSVIYFSAPKEYLGNKLSSYGGKLKYTIFYTTGLFGNAISQADVILQGSNFSIIHSGIEQPPSNINWQKNLTITESEFTTLSGLPATRELIMTILENLQGVYIKASYWDALVTTRLGDVSLDFGNDIWDKDSELATSVEECQCPVNYKGNSCEECAEGYYRIPGTHGGICIPCQCNGHAASCDVNTGICYDCQHATTGDHCEICIEGYHGNATNGTPNDCLICACPLPISSNNFATGCEVSSNGEHISCNCRPEYFGALCESCAPGYYGQPQIPGDFCKPCECSGNINTNDPGACDTVTGECLKCMNYTAGEGCSLCQPGYYGDAITLKDCQVCICDQLGMDKCNSYTGLCECKSGVVGDKCDRCEDEHWGFEYGNGCAACNCSIASQSKQCDDSTGQCKCMPGVTGKQCDRCAPGFWNFSPKGCVTCDCNTDYSVGFGCNASTGHCECLPGVIGEKCDRCPYRYVLIPEEGCFGCDSCTHDLLNSTDELFRLIDPVMVDFETKASSHFTAQRLFYIDDKVNSLRENVNLLDPDAVDLKEISNKLDEMELLSKNLDRMADYGIKDSAKIKKNAESLITQCGKLQDDIKSGAVKTNATVKQIQLLANNLVTGKGQIVDNALAEAQQILQDIQEKDISPQMDAALAVQKFSNDSFNDILNFTKPISDSQMVLETAQKKMHKFNDDLKDLLDIHDKLQDKIDSTEKLNNVIHRISNIKNKVAGVNNASNDSNNNLKNASYLIKNATKFLELTKTGLGTAQNEFNEGFNINNQVNMTLNNRNNEINTIEDLINQTENHRSRLLNMSNVLQNLLKKKTTNSQTENAVKAASAYFDIVKEIKEAQNSSMTAQIASKNASLLNNELKDHITPSQENSTKLYKESLDALSKVQATLKPRLTSAEKTVNEIIQKNQNSDDENNAIAQSLPVLPYEMEDFTKQIEKNSSQANETSKNVLQLSTATNTTDKLNKAKNVSKEMHDTLNGIELAKNQLNKINEASPNIKSLIKDVQNMEELLDEKKKTLEKLKGELEKSVATAKDTANRIKVGVKFNEGTLLQLPMPENIEEMGTSTHVSVYFKTPKENGFLLYIGNPKGSKHGRAANTDFMALEIENKYPYVIMDIGNGPEKIYSDKIVSDDTWYQAIIDRVGNNVKFTIREQLSNKSIHDNVVEKKLSGLNTVLNLNKDQSKLYVGGYPTDINDELRFAEFEGEMEELIIGDTQIGLWNFIEGQDNNNGAIERNVLLSKSTTGFRFNGEGYVKIDGRSYPNRERSQIQFSFSTFTLDGLMFLIGKDTSFLSIELRNGSVFFQYRLNGEPVVIGTTAKFDDGNWHIVQAIRDGKKGKLVVDGHNSDIFESSGAETDLMTTDFVYFGGYPGKHNFVEVINTGFDGCIDEVKLSRTAIDLNQNNEAFGVKPGCPNKFSSSVKVDGRGSIKVNNITVSNDFRLSIRFKTSAKLGLIFYSTDIIQDHYISLSIARGSLSLQSNGEELTSGSNTYNDNQWHTVTVTHNPSALSMIVDDYEPYVTDSPPPPLHIMYGTLFVGGIPHDYTVRPGRVLTKEAFVGCLGDATVNDNMINFAADQYGKTLRSCQKSGISSLLHVPTGSEIPTSVPKKDVQQLPPKRKDDVPIVTKPSVIQTTTSVPASSPPVTVLTLKPTTIPPDLLPKFTPPTPEEGCALGYDPISNQWDHSKGFRFGTRYESRVEFDKLPDTFQNDFKFSVDFKTKMDDGLIFYASDVSHQNFIALFMHEGLIYFNFDYKIGLISLKSNKGDYNDDKWHNVVFKKTSQIASLIIDTEKVAATETVDLLKPLFLDPPFYFGGYSGNISENHIKPFTYSPFKGCLKNLQMNGKPVNSIKAKIHTLPCIQNEENGIYFRPGGGYLRLIENFFVGDDTTISLQIKSRNSSGLLAAVHGKKHYLILEIVDNTVVLRVNSGKGPYEARYKPNVKYLICDGKWHTIMAVKSKYVVTLGIDDQYGQAGIGNRKSATLTTTALFIGGHPTIQKKGRLNGATVRQGFSGCIKNINIKSTSYENVHLKNAHGDVHIGMCPTD